MEKMVFSTDSLAPGLNDQARVSAWHDFVVSAVCPLDVVDALPDLPFSQCMEVTPLDGVAVTRMRGTTSRLAWISGSLATRPADFYLCLNRSAAPMSVTQRGREVEFGDDIAMLGSCTEFGDARWQSANDVTFVAVQQARLRELVANAEDLLARPLPGGEAARLLRRYLDILPTPSGLEDTPALVAHVGRTVTDLVALALGAGRDAAEIASQRGLRAARLQEIVTAIRADFSDAAFSAQTLGARLGVSARHIQDLLQETGASFTDRVLELRLQRARAMLADPRHQCLKIAEIADLCGFNEIPYFNRCFRRRFGGTPTQFRGGRAD
ncbi:MAG TPA: AraC family transcriptional regulator [Xanthobacteraceae bacterium]|nr:AraC family transcriptional regulator [Xanthobacteraceae bacterium]